MNTPLESTQPPAQKSTRVNVFKCFFGVICWSIVSSFSLYLTTRRGYDLQAYLNDAIVPEYLLRGVQPQQRTMKLNTEPLNRMINDDKNPPSIRTLFKILKHHTPPGRHSEEIRESNFLEDASRCARYGFSYDPGLKHRRRIFFGSTVADDSWHAFGTHAAEAYGLYHTVVLVESNRTFNFKPRQMRFVEGSSELEILQSGIFGPTTDVQIGHYFNEDYINPLLNEHLQREVILKHWKNSGMTVDDIGIVSDVDEMFSRDFLLAVQACDVPDFRRHQDCRAPKVIGKTLIFESSPDCIRVHDWYHPDMMIGRCIDGIGDAALHFPPAERNHMNGTLGFRINGKGKESSDWNNLPKRSRYPLWKPVDFRSAEGGKQFIKKDGSPQNHTAFHLHNFFVSIKTLRHKYSTYGHPKDNVESLSLGQIQGDIDVMVKCVMERETAPNTPVRYTSFHEGMDGIIEGGGEVPLLFGYPEYTNARHDELKTEIMKDEEKYGNFTVDYSKI